MRVVAAITALQLADAHADLRGDRDYPRSRAGQRHAAAPTSGSGSGTPRDCKARNDGACGSEPAAS